MAEKARAEARNDAWRAERREAHAAVLSVMEDAKKALDDVIRSKIEEGPAGKIVSLSGVLNAWSAELRDRMTNACATVAIVGSERSREAMEDLHAKARGANLNIWLATMFQHDDTVRNVPTYADVKAEVAAIAYALAAYTAAVRQDIGTAD